MDAQDVGLQAGERLGNPLQGSGLVQHEGPRPPQGRRHVQLVPVAECRGVQPAPEDLRGGGLGDPDHQDGRGHGEQQDLGQIGKMGFHHRRMDQKFNGKHDRDVGQGQPGFGRFGQLAADIAPQVRGNGVARVALHGSMLPRACFEPVAGASRSGYFRVAGRSCPVSGPCIWADKRRARHSLRGSAGLYLSKRERPQQQGCAAGFPSGWSRRPSPGHFRGRRPHPSRGRGSRQAARCRPEAALPRAPRWRGGP
ncbi:hypothetical protein PJL18_02540 [Paenarthrobacter nicotinovorans]|nr:hypothetical protein [Paenarthrobacter nicotinovorans]